MSTDDYPADWNSRRQKIYSRDGHQCQNCGIYGGSEGDAELHAHHIVPKSNGGTHDTTNLITICKQCHMAVHGDKNAPTKGSNKNTSLGRIHDAASLFSVLEQYHESRSIVNGALCIPTGDIDEHSDYEIMKDTEFTDIIKNAREELTECRFRLEEMDINYTEFAESVGNSNRSEIKSVVEKLAESVLRDIELLLQGANLSQEYINTISVVICPGCERESNPQDSFCGECGEALPDIWSCSDCGERIDNSTQKFCKSCGSQITTFPKSQKNDIESLRNRTDEIEEPLNDQVKKVNDFSSKLEKMVS